MSLRIATWNVNSLRQRLDHLARFAEAVRAMGYPHLLIHG